MSTNDKHPKVGDIVITYDIIYLDHHDSNFRYSEAPKGEYGICFDVHRDCFIGSFIFPQGLIKSLTFDYVVVVSRIGEK